KFIAGADKLHGIKAKKANEVFDVMEKFAEYGFNRSHSAAYSVVAYQTGYLKANYPAEYMAAGAGEAAVLELVEERQKNGPFTDVFDFAKRVNLRAVNKKTWESLAQAGAFDSFEKYNRRQFMDAPAGDQNLIEKALKLGQQHQAAKESAQH
nr:DNA polymerase III, alpha subunit [Tanacetum cinerariifolium]